MLGLDVGVIGDTRADIGIKAEGFASGYVEGLEAATLWGGNGGFEEDLSAAQGFPRARFNACVDAAEVDFLANFDGFFLDARAGGLHDVERSGHDFGADTVTMSNGDGDKVR